ncbi:hypothetical protein [Aquiflexum sp.]|uniref:hypothetical protein n=1 Tax=Aquiflexum sp. TaxID=1872584 RepID=UPI0035935007
MADTPYENNEALKTIYDQLCTSYHSVDDFRAKLLGILPLVSGVAIFEILGKVETPSYLSPIGFLGVITTLGLLIYEMKGILKCDGYIKAGLEIEKILLKTLPTNIGHFGSLVKGDKKSNFITVPVASAFVYAAVIGAWTFVATFKLSCIEQMVSISLSIIASLSVWLWVYFFSKSLSKPDKSKS